MDKNAKQRASFKRESNKRKNKSKLIMKPSNKSKTTKVSIPVIIEKLRECDTTDIPNELWNQLLSDMNKTKSFSITKKEDKGICYIVKVRGIKDVFYIGILEEEEEEIKEQVNHPSHYGGADNPYEAIKVINAWGLGFELGNTIKYISRAGKKSKDGKDNKIEDLKKSLWYLQYEIDKLVKNESGNK